MIWKCRNKNIICNEKTLVMGIVNITPDSFSDAGEHICTDEAVQYALKLCEKGADIIDIGAQSTRPGYVEITPEEELMRLLPVLSSLREKTDVPVSVDTYFPEVAQKCLEHGADIINDVSGSVSLKMADVIKKYSAGWVIMHNGNGSVEEVGKFFSYALSRCETLGISRESLCFDMGIGFGKTRQQDRELIANIEKYRVEDVPVMLGSSRKRVIGDASMQQIPSKRTYGNISADTIAILGGVNIIRLHDVENEIQGILMAQALKGAIIDG